MHRIKIEIEVQSQERLDQSSEKSENLYEFEKLTDEIEQKSKQEEAPQNMHSFKRRR